MREKCADGAFKLNLGCPPHKAEARKASGVTRGACSFSLPNMLVKPCFRAIQVQGPASLDFLEVACADTATSECSLIRHAHSRAANLLLGSFISCFNLTCPELQMCGSIFESTVVLAIHVTDELTGWFSWLLGVWVSCLGDVKTSLPLA